LSSVHEIKQGPGTWDLVLRAETPREVLDAITPFGHIAVVPGKIDPVTVGDDLLTQARYVGVYRGTTRGVENFTLHGAGMAFWLGDEDGKGPVFTSVVSASALSFANAIRLMLPPAITEGTLTSVAGTYTEKHIYETPRSAINHIVNVFGSDSNPVSWRVNGNGTLDAGPDSSLFVTTPTAIMVRKGVGVTGGRELGVVAVGGNPELEYSWADYTTKVFWLADGEKGSTVTASASLAASAIPFKDIHGGTVNFTRLVDSTDTDSTGSVAGLAVAMLNRFGRGNTGVLVSTDDYDVRGDFRPGDWIGVYDPDIGFINVNNEMFYEGLPLNPVYLQVTEMTWPIREGYTIAFRDYLGTWLDLSSYYEPLTGGTLLEVGDNPSQVTDITLDRVDEHRVRPDFSVPATPVFATFYSTHYLNLDGRSRASVFLDWAQPLNSDGSTIIDGDHYEIRYRPNASVAYPATWAEAAQDTWDELFTWMQPRVPPFTVTDWQVINVPWDQTQVMVHDLFPSVTYEFQIRAVDTATPPNKSAWSASQTHTMARDTLPPSQPAAPIVASSRLALQITHYLGTSAGGTFNLEADTTLLEVHVSSDPLFFPDATTLVGRMLVSTALASQTPVVATFGVESTIGAYVRVVAVDRDGNKSQASNTATGTITLIDDAHISDLTVSKVTAGTITATWLMSGTIRTAPSGERAELTSTGLKLYNSAGVLKTHLDPNTGQLRIYSTGDLSPTSTAHGFQLGQSSGINMAIDENEIMARNNGVPSNLYLNQEGGYARVGGKVGGFRDDNSDIGVFPAGFDNAFVVIAHTRIEDMHTGDYADEYPPLTIGREDDLHLWFDNNNVGAANGDTPTTFHIMPPESGGTVHTVATAVASDTLFLESLTTGGANSGIRGANAADVGLQFFNSQLLVRTDGWLAYQPIVAQAFTLSSQRDLKYDVTDIDPLAIVENAPSTKWKYVDQIETTDNWHVGPMAEDLPPELVRIIKGDEESEHLGVDLAVIAGVAWEGVRQLAARVKTLEKLLEGK
jgi:hypothetical protein